MFSSLRLNSSRPADVSVVVPCYRCAATLVRAIDSVLAQTLLPLEIILVDDFSNDGTLDLLYELQMKHGSDLVKIVEMNLNLGAASARNRGWDIAVGRYVAFLDADDSWHPRKLELQYLWLNSNPGVALLGHRMAIRCEDEVGFSEEIGGDFVVKPVSIHKLLFSNCFSTPTVMLRRDLNFRFPEGVRYAEDYCLWLNIAAFSGGCFIFDLVLAYMYKQPYGVSGLSARLWLMQKGEVSAYYSLYRHDGRRFYYVFVFMIFSFLKFFRRLLRSSLSRFC